MQRLDLAVRLPTMTAQSPVRTIDLGRIAKVRAWGRSGFARQFRIDAGIHGREMAPRVGVNASTLKRWEDGDVTPKAEHAMAWAEALAELGAPL